MDRSLRVLSKYDFARIFGILAETARGPFPTRVYQIWVMLEILVFYGTVSDRSLRVLLNLNLSHYCIIHGLHRKNSK